MIPLIKIEINEHDAKQFLEYQKRYAFIQFLEKIGVFTGKFVNGNITINFDSNGQIASVDKKEHIKI